MNAARDVIIGIRVLRRTPGVTIAAILALAIGIAANTIVFSVVDTAFLRPLPYDNPDALVLLNERLPLDDLSLVAYEDYLDWRQDVTAFQALAAHNRETFNLTGVGEPEQVLGSNVAASLFDVLHVAPSLGRLFTADDDRRGAAPVVVITHSSWTGRFHADPNVVGRRVVLDGVPRTIVGVLPPHIRYPVTDAMGEFFSPIGRLESDLGGRANRSVSVIGRLKTGVTLERARLDLDVAAARLSTEYPSTNRDVRTRVDRYRDRVVGPSATLVVALWGAVALVWLVACANAATLITIRGATRAREFAIRLALGASRIRLLRQVLTESLLLAAIAAGLGVLVAAFALPAMVALLPSDLPRVPDIALNGHVLGYLLLTTPLAALLAGILPAWQAATTPLYQTASAGLLSGVGRPKMRAALVVGQLALSELLLITAGLLTATLAHLLHTDTGFRPDRLAAALYYLPDAKYDTRERVIDFHRTLHDRVAQLPGVISAALITPPPFGFGGGQTDVVIEGRDGTIRIDGFRAGPGALTTLGAPLRAGRFFDDRDGRDAPTVAVIDEDFASTYLGGVDPLRRRIRLERSDTWMAIVGVAGHIVTRSLETPDRPQIYLPLYGTTLQFTSVIVRTIDRNPMTIMAAVRKSASELDPDLPLFNAAPMTTLIENTTARQQLGAYLLSSFAGAALTLAAIGLAGVVAYSITLRTREFGIRLALGAEPRSLVVRLVAYGSGLTLVGLMLGLAGGIAASRVLSTHLAGVGPIDPLLLITTTVTLVATGVVASYVPARRALSIDLVATLKND